MEEKQTYVLGHRHKRADIVEKRVVQGTLYDYYEGLFSMLEVQGRGEHFYMFLATSIRWLTLWRRGQFRVLLVTVMKADLLC